MRIDEQNDRRFTTCNVASAGLGLASIIVSGLAVNLMMAGGPVAIFGRWLFICCPALGLLGVILNVRGLARIREGQAGVYDLILTWPGFLGAALTCLAYSALLLVLVVA